EANDMEDNWDGERPKAIPLMPEIIDIATCRKNKDVTKALQAARIPMGLDFPNVEVVAHDIAVNDLLMIYSVDASMR
ncbi:hypothetical protein, partial [Bacillus paralicheniformis]|uniref:hypothetical protein n=1 Tax=Bacillus paralicheniformis TaxID=1648923 RepID=UPI0020C01206